MAFTAPAKLKTVPTSPVRVLAPDVQTAISKATTYLTNTGVVSISILGVNPTWDVQVP